MVCFRYIIVNTLKKDDDDDDDDNNNNNNNNKNKGKNFLQLYVYTLSYLSKAIHSFTCLTALKI